jgi:hypothetical protein
MATQKFIPFYVPTPAGNNVASLDDELALVVGLTADRYDLGEVTALYNAQDDLGSPLAELIGAALDRARAVQCDRWFDGLDDDTPAGWNQMAHEAFDALVAAGCW